jgi:hypothetical protein
VSWAVEVDPDVWSVDTIRLPDSERAAVRNTIESWIEPPEAITTLQAGRIVQEFHMANGIVIKFVTDEDDADGGLLQVIRVMIRNWFPSD